MRKWGESSAPRSHIEQAEGGRRPGAPTLDLVLEPRRILIFLLACVGVLLIGGSLSAMLAVGLDIELGLETGARARIARLFHLDAERSIPAYFSSLLLLAAGVLLGLIALEHAQRPGLRGRWVVLALGFVWLAFDEAASIHEALNPIARGYLGLQGLGGVAWTVPILVVVGILAAAYVPFLRALPRRYVRLFLAAAALYLGGAIGVEIVGGGLKESFGVLSWAYQIEVVIEEACEMLGVVLFIYALTSYLTELGSVVRLRAVAEDRALAPRSVGPVAQGAARAVSATAGAFSSQGVTSASTQKSSRHLRRESDDAR